jgi:hypothetical protein
MTSDELKRCRRFLIKNGWYCVNRKDDLEKECLLYGESLIFQKDYRFKIDINIDRIIINTFGININIKTNYFALIGVLLNYHQIGLDYIRVEAEE